MEEYHPIFNYEPLVDMDEVRRVATEAEESRCETRGEGITLLLDIGLENRVSVTTDLPHDTHKGENFRFYQWFE